MLLQCRFRGRPRHNPFEPRFSSLTLQPNRENERTTLMKILTLIVRILFGLMFVVFGLNGFLDFMPKPKEPPKGHALEFFTALSATGYLRVVMALQLIGGVLVLSGRFLPLGLLLLGPVIVNILLFHVFMAPNGLAM